MDWLEVVELAWQARPSHATLALRVSSYPWKTKFERRFVVRNDDGSEVGYFAVRFPEVETDPQEGFIEEVYVLPSQRRAGIGSFILRAAERLILDAGFRQAALLAVPLERMDRKALALWYSRRGYRDAGAGFMVKRLRRQAVLDGT